MAKEFKLQDPGEGIHEAEILEVHVSPNETVEEEDILLTIETDKAAVEIPSPFSGTVQEIRVEVGDMVEVGETLITYSEDGAAAEEEAEEAPEEESEEPGARAEPETEADELGEERKAKEERAAEGKPAEQEEAGVEAAPEATERKPRPVPAAPATRRLARELGVDLRAIEPSGPEGRVTAEDVRAAAGKAEAAPEEEAPEKPRDVGPEGEAVAKALVEERKPVQLPRIQAPPLPDFTRWGEVERVPLRSVRRATAERMALAWSQVAHVTHQDIADITELERFRREHQEDVEEAGGKLTLTVLVMKAVVGALKEFPRFNASLDVDAEEIILKKYYHIGVAVETERGLIVPVVRDADCKTIRELAVELTELAERARDGEVGREDMTGGTFTITNPGPIGGTGFTPIINWPQVSILGIARARLEPVVKGDLDDYEIVPRMRLPLALGFDHRVIDGADAAHFCQRMIEFLHDPETLMLTT